MNTPTLPPIEYRDCATDDVRAWFAKQKFAREQEQRAAARAKREEADRLYLMHNREDVA